MCQCVICHCVAGPVSVCYMSQCCTFCVVMSVFQTFFQYMYMSLFDRTCVSVFTYLCVTGPVSVYLHVSVLQDLCQCVYMSLCYRTCVSVFTCLCYRTCVSVFTCLCVTGPVSVCLHVSVLQDLCQCVYMSVLQDLCRCAYMSLCYRTCVSVFACLCVTGPVSVCLHVSVLQDLCQCVRARDLREAVDRCLCGDRMPDTAYLHSSHTPVPQSLWSRLRDALRHRSTHVSGQHALGQLALWWHRLGRDGNMSRTLYDRLLARSVCLLNKLITQR